MAKSIAEMNFKIVSQYDNTGARLAMQDVSDSRRMIEGMSASARMPKIDPIADQMGSTNRQMMTEWQAAQNAKVAAVEAANAKIEAANIQSQAAARASNARAAAEAIQRIEAEEAAWKKSLASKATAMNAGSPSKANPKQSLIDEQSNRQKQLDREVWAQRARLRDEDIQRETASQQSRQKTEQILSQARVLSASMIDRANQQQAAKDASNKRTAMALEKTRHDQAMDFIFQEGSAASGRMVGGGGSGAAGVKVGGLSTGSAQALGQVGFMIQDFQSQMVNAKTMVDGLGRGIMAISNNVQMLGASFGPTGMAVSAIGGALAGVVLPAMIRWLTSTDELEAKTKAIESSYETMKPMFQGVKDVAGFGGSKSGGVDARKQIDSLTDERSALARQSAMIQKQITGEMADASPNENKIGAWRQNLTEVNAEYEKIDQRLKVIQTEWTPRKIQASTEIEKEMSVRSKVADFNSQENAKSVVQADEALQKKKAAIDEELTYLRDRMQGASAEQRQLLSQELGDKQKASEENAKVIEMTRAKVARANQEVLAENQKKAAEKAAAEDVKRQSKEIDKAVQIENQKQMALGEEKDKIQKLADQTPNGSSAGNVRGTAAATSAINRASAGTRSAENDAKAVVKKLDEQIKVSQKIEQKLQFKKAELAL